jgi:hypothetical protein
MIKDVFGALAAATRKLFRNWLALLMILVLYLALLGCFYLFISTREATIGQLLLTLVLGITAPVLWFLIQAIAVRYTDGERAGKLLVHSLRSFWKLVLIVLPLVIVIGLAVYYLGSVEIKSVQETVRSVAAPRRPQVPKPPAAHAMSWQAVALSTLQYLLLWLVLPLASIQLWIEAGRNGLKQSIKSMPRTVGRAFLPRSVLTYAIGFVFFAVLPYLLVLKRTTVSNPWLDLSLLGARLVLAVVLSLIGWVITVGALSILSTRTAVGAEETTPNFEEGRGHVPVRT